MYFSDVDSTALITKAFAVGKFADSAKKTVIKFNSASNKRGQNNSVEVEFFN
jgi:hypothetical protein